MADVGRKLRVVLDSNVVIAGLLKPGGTPGRIVAAWRAGVFRLVLSEFMLAEITEALGRPKLERLLGWTPETIARFALELRAQCDVVEPAAQSGASPRDPDDAPVLATLLASGAEVLVTGDKDLLVLREHHSIVTPAEFLRRL